MTAKIIVCAVVFLVLFLAPAAQTPEVEAGCNTYNNNGVAFYWRAWEGDWCTNGIENTVASTFNVRGIISLTFST